MPAWFNAGEAKRGFASSTLMAGKASGWFWTPMAMEFTLPAMEDQFAVTCPYCGETVEIYLEADVEGELIQDCEVCCNPWVVTVWSDGEDRHVQLGRTDGAD